MPTIKGDLDIQNLIEIHDSSVDYFNKLHARGSENERYYSADPFDEKERGKIGEKDRIPFSISSIPQKLNSIIATERKNRVSWKAKVRIDPDDISDDPGQQQQLFTKELKANLATLRMKMIESQNQAIYKYSDIFASGVAVIYGVAKVWADVNRYGDTVIRLSDVDYKNFIWDRNSVEYEHNDAVWMAEKKYVYRMDLRKQFPQKLVDELSIGDAATRWGRKKWQYYVNYNTRNVSDLDLITVIEHYHKNLRPYYTTLFGANVIGCTRHKKEAETLLRKAQLPYLESGKDLPPADIVKTPKLMLDKYLFTYTDILEFEETDMDEFLYSIYQAFQFKNKIWTMSDILKSMQQLANRMLQQMDYALGVDVKNDYEMVMPNIEAAGITKEEAIRALKEDHIVPVGQAGTFNPIKSQGFNPQYAEVMQIMLSLIDEIGGGKTFSGNANSAHQSGKAVNMLVAQGQMLTDAFIDNRNRFLQDLGRKTLYQIKKYDSAPYVARIEGGSLSPEMLQLLQQDNQFIQSKENPAAGYLKMNEGGSNYLEDAEFDLDIVEESQNENKMAMEYEMMGQIEQSDEDLKLSPTWRKKKLEHIPNLDYSDRNKIIKEITDAKTAQAQQVQQQQQHANDMEKTKMLHEISKNKNVNKQQQPANAQ